MTETHQLLAEFVRSRSQPAFRELVERYYDLVYSTAARRVGEGSQQARDVAQHVFMDLANAAQKLPPDVQLGGWLHHHTCFVTSKLIRTEKRRQNRETEAARMNPRESTTDANFDQIAPLLDDAIDELPESDRTAIVLRFFERRDFRSVGESLATSEDAARMRVSRAIDKLRGILSRRGVTVSAVALASLMFDQSVRAAPAGAVTTALEQVLRSSAVQGTAKLIAIKVGAVAAGGAIVVAAGIAITLAVTGSASSAPSSAPATTQPTTRAATTAPLTTFVAKLTGTKGAPFKGLIVSDGVTQKVSGTLPQKLTTQGNDVKFAIQLNGKGWIAIDVSENGKSLGSSNTGDTTFGGVLATFLRGKNDMSLFTTFDKDQDPAGALKDR
jgi:RNA polymerase sigma factor (sigma-70 family)